jgi:TetR/AcrR family transcriptional repressor of nem operon
MTGRPRKVAAEQALSSAIGVFWSCGYEAASIDALTSAMGIGRGSLYNTFDNKHDLFLGALDRYRSERHEQLDRALSSEGPARSVIEVMFRTSIDRLWGDPRRKGCLLVNSAAELAATDPTVAARARETLERFVSAFQRALERGNLDGSIAAEIDLRATSRFLATTFLSLRLLATFASREVAHDVVEVTLRQLDVRRTDTEATG